MTATFPQVTVSLKLKKKKKKVRLGFKEFIKGSQSVSIFVHFEYSLLGRKIEGLVFVFWVFFFS